MTDISARQPSAVVKWQDLLDIADGQAMPVDLSPVLTSIADVRDALSGMQTDVNEVQTDIATLAAGKGYNSFITLTPFSYWQDKFDSVWAAELAKNGPLSLNASSYEMIVNVYQALNGNRLMWMATGATKYLERALLYIENMISTAAVSSSLPAVGLVFGDSYLGWLNLSTVSEAARMQENALYESFSWQHVMLILQEMMVQNLHVAPSPYQARWEAIRAFTEVNIWEKWYVRGYETWMFRSLTHMAAHWAVIAMCQTYTGSTQSLRNQAQSIWDQIDHTGMAVWGGASLRGQMRLNVNNPNAYWWDSVWGQTTQDATHHGQDSSHGKDVIFYVIEAHRLGHYWDDRDIKRFLYTLWNHVFNPAASYYSTYVDGYGKQPGPGNMGWGMLCRFDPLLQFRYQNNEIAANWEHWAVEAYNVWYLDNNSVPLPPVNSDVTVTIDGLTAEGIGAVGISTITALQAAVDALNAIESLDDVPDSATRVAVTPADLTKLRDLTPVDSVAERPVSVPFTFITQSLTSSSNPGVVREYANSPYRRLIPFGTALQIRSEFLVSGTARPAISILFQYALTPMPSESDFVTLTDLTMQTDLVGVPKNSGWHDVPSALTSGPELITVRIATSGGDGTSNSSVTLKEVSLHVKYDS